MTVTAFNFIQGTNSKTNSSTFSIRTTGLVLAIIRVRACRRPMSLRDRLVSTKFKTVNTLVPRGWEACGNLKCSWCKGIKETTTFTSCNNNKTFKIFHSVNCQSWWVIYIIECNTCNLQYIGKSETAFNLRLNNHRNHIKKGISSCELTENFLHNKRTHNFDNNVIITKQIRKDNISNEQKKMSLDTGKYSAKENENSMQPNGLNKRIG